MINQDYYQDIKKFPRQFKQGFQQAASLSLDSIPKTPKQVVICGMGGSSLYVELINDLLASLDLAPCLIPNRRYQLPVSVGKDYLIIISSYSGNTEETLSCLDDALSKKLSTLVFTSGGKLLRQAQQHNLPTYQIPSNLQPRLSTGYYIAATLTVLHKVGLIPDLKDHVLTAGEKLEEQLNEDQAQKLAKELKGQLPIIYATDNNSSIARISKIKFNENSKTQAFWNYFPELNHNEMVGFTNLVTRPHFIIYRSKFTYPRNLLRIRIFSQLMEKRQLPVTQLKLPGDSVFQEIMNTYYFVDHLTYYLALEYNVDPEPVIMVEEFKEQLSSLDS